MDLEHDEVKMSKKRVSILQGDENFFNRVISRDCSVGCSSPEFYHRSSDGVPFQWERQPGTPKHPPKGEIIPPLSPPPAVISLGLPKPCIAIEEPKPSFGSRFQFLKQMISKKIRRSNVITNGKSYSSSPSLSNEHSRQSSKLESPAFKESLQGPYGCSPWNFHPILKAFDPKNSSFKSRKDDRVMSLYQVDPAFYRKIVSRSSSMDSFSCGSFHGSPGNVPFDWETQPGEPINSPSPRIELVSPPPGFPADLHNGLNKPRTVHGSCVPRPNLALVRAKANFSRNIKKSVEIIKNNIRFGQGAEEIKKGIHIFFKKVKGNTLGPRRKNYEANHNFTSSFTSGLKVPSSSFIMCYRMTAKVTIVQGGHGVMK